MAQYDAIVVGAGHNGLAAAVILQKAGRRTLCLDANLYSGGMASTVELFDGYRFEIAGSEQFPTALAVSRELELDRVPSVEQEVMSVNLRGNGDAPFIFYADPMKLLNHVNEVHGADALAGMAGLMAWSQAPARALGRFDADLPPKTYDQMYACATNEFERSAITDMLFGSVTEVLDRYLPDKDRHGAMRGMMSVLACNSTYRGPATPGSAAALAFGLAVPGENATLMRKIKGGIGALTEHLAESLVAHGGEIRLRSAVSDITAAAGRVTGVRLEDGTEIAAPVVVSAVAPSVTVGRLAAAALPDEVRSRYTRVDHRGSYLQMHFALDGIPEFAEPYGMLNDPELQSTIGIFSTPEELQRQWEDAGRGIVPAEPSIAWQIPSVQDPALAPPGKHASSAFALWFPVAGVDGEDSSTYGANKREMGQRVIDKITRLAPNFEKLILRHTTFTPRHMDRMFGAPGGDFCHGLVHPDQMGPNRPGPRGFIDQELPIAGLYLGSAGCHGGPAVNFIPGYNAAHAVLSSC